MTAGGLMASACMMIAVAASIGRAQSCAPDDHAYLEYEITKAHGTFAKFVGDLKVLPRPRGALPGDRDDDSIVRVQMTVDTAGAVVQGTLRFVKAPSQEVRESVQAAATTWRYKPAEVGGCRVRQFVQSLVRYKP